ncbi:hypothetical protein BDV24DRAFT_159088 [Aspergillus arachidicola]|uniref:Uncharacterized protein n=1 Tax=Aspergillus arachidicola TaxID=656916 RepID=A0A5N6YJR2_9EURO|nr:hypothetical protein BDV24DRAFT_159088 [Aspergillus arachidicola]
MDPSCHLPQHDGTLAENFSGFSPDLHLDNTMSRCNNPNPVRTNSFEYKGYTSFIATILQNRHHNELKILEFSNVTAKDFEVISPDHRPLKSIRLTYNYATKALAVKMLGCPHEFITRLFEYRIHDNLIALNVEEDVNPTGAYTSTFGDWAKEPDSSWNFAMTNERRVVLEVGSSETAARLKGDARGWLESTGSSVVACVTINIEENSLIFDVWQRGSRTYPISSRNFLCPAIKTQHVEIINGRGDFQIRRYKLAGSTTVVTEELRFKLELFTAKTSEEDLVITRTDLLKLAKRFWSWRASLN